ncbi:MAG: lytic transglycosylase domain-containing protein [Desulfurellales bacterium]|nr:MAG: lytic transglycosylase domain-containing protein [Desulfurellales bacterium]
MQFTQAQIDEEIDKILPKINAGKSLPVPRELARAIFAAENMGPRGEVSYANRTSNKAASGVAQVIPPTIRGLKRQGRLREDFPEDLSGASLPDQVLAGLASLQEFIDRKKTNDPYKIAALYNAGDAAAAKYLASGNIAELPKETQGYLTKLQTGYKMQGLPVPPTTAEVSARPAPEFAVTPMSSVSRQDTFSIVPDMLSALFSANKAQQQAGASQQQATRIAGEAAAESARLQAESIIAEQQVHSDIMSALGLDVRDPASAVRTELDKSAQARATREQLGAQIAERQGRSLFSDPLGWIQNIVEMPQLVAQHNLQVDLESNADARVRQLQNAGAQAKAMTAAKSADLLRAKSASDARMFLAKAEADVAEISAKNAAGEAKTLLDAWNIQRQAVNDAASERERAEAREDRKISRQERMSQQAEKEAAKRQESELLVRVHAVRTMIGGNVPRWTPEEFKKLPPQERVMWEQLAFKNGNFGSIPTAVAFIKEYGDEVGATDTGNAGMVQQVRSLEMQAKQLATKIANDHNMKNPLAKMNDKQALEAAYNALQSEADALATKNSNKDNIPANSPYAIDYDAIAAAARGNPDARKWIVGDILAREKEKRPYESLNATITPRFLVDSVRAEVLAGKIDPAVASVQLADFYRTASGSQYVTAGLRYFGLKPFQDFIISPEAVGGPKIDLFNPTTIDRYLVTQVARNRARESMAIPMGRAGGPFVFN